MRTKLIFEGIIYVHEMNPKSINHNALYNKRYTKNESSYTWATQFIWSDLWLLKLENHFRSQVA